MGLNLAERYTDSIAELYMTDVAYGTCMVIARSCHSRHDVVFVECHTAKAGTDHPRTADGGGEVGHELGS